MKILPHLLFVIIILMQPSVHAPFQNSSFAVPLFCPTFCAAKRYDWMHPVIFILYKKSFTPCPTGQND